MTGMNIARWAVLAMGFRIFFFLGAVWAVAIVAVWSGVYAFGWTIPNVFPPIAWHGREMLFGYAGAIIAAFLLTAPGNWTGRRMMHGPALGALALLWLAGRLLPLAGDRLPLPVAFAVDVAFYPVLGVYLFVFLYRAGQTQNLFFPFLLLVMGLCNALTYGGWRTVSGALLGSEAMLYLILVVIGIMGGRVIPGFTRGRFPQGRVRANRHLDRWAMIVLIAVALADLAVPPGWWIGVLFGAATVLHGARLWGWHTREIFSDPLTWVLHAAYAWLVIGLALKALWGFEIGNPLLARHAFSVGTVGTITLGMMCRVTIGHTGHAFVLPRMTVTAFMLVSLAALLRVVMPLLVPQTYMLGVQLSSQAWVLAFGVYLVQYAPMLFRPRADGLPG